MSVEQEEFGSLLPAIPSKRLFVYRNSSYVLKAIEPLADSSEQEIFYQASKFSPQPVAEALGGRATMNFFDGPGSKQYVLKSYRRGGLMRNILPGGLFLGWGIRRSTDELRALVTAAELGLRVPTPIGTLTRGSWLIREWLIMGALPVHRTLAGLALTGEDDESIPFEKYLREVVDQIEILIQHKIVHVDLHPGNVVVANDGSVYLIDFDHAYVSRETERQLRDRYIRRWRRAVIKHELPEYLSEIFCSLLRRRPSDGEPMSQPELTS
ncbi:MAG: hypothetical protein KDD70_13755 [Bdellovibrionales bacterium]|nr:hypothetical protein [Bdellovibrionales bacterium]